MHDLIANADLPPVAVAPLAAKISRAALTGPSQTRDIAGALRAALRSGVLDARQEAMTRYQLGTMLETVDDFDGSRRELGRRFPASNPDRWSCCVR